MDAAAAAAESKEDATVKPEQLLRPTSKLGKLRKGFRSAQQAVQTATKKHAALAETLSHKRLRAAGGPVLIDPRAVAPCGFAAVRQAARRNLMSTASAVKGPLPPNWFSVKNGEKPKYRVHSHIVGARGAAGSLQQAGQRQLRSGTPMDTDEAEAAAEAADDDDQEATSKPRRKLGSERLSRARAN